MLQFIHSHQAKLAAVTAVVGVAAYLLLPKLLPSLLKKKARDPTLLPALTEEEVLRVLNKVFDKLKIQAARMVSAAENIRAQIEQQGQQIDDEKLMRHFILPHFETAMAEVYAKVFDEMEVDEDEVDDAKTFYIKAGHKELKDVVNRINTLHKEFGGSVEVDDGDGEDDGRPVRDLSVVEVVALLETLAERMGDVTDSYVEEFKAEHGVPTEATIGAFQEGMMSLSEDMEKEVLEEHGVSMLEFQRAVKRNQSSTAIQSTIMKMQMENQMRLQSHGIPMRM